MKTIAHELGHNLNLPHIFCHQVESEQNNSSCINLIRGKREMAKFTAPNNFMDYTSSSDNRNMFFKYQMENVELQGKKEKTKDENY